MFVLSAKLTFYVPMSKSLKDKRMVARRLLDKTRHKFKVSIAEVGTQEAHQTLTIGFAVVSGEHSHAVEMQDEIIRYLDGNTDAELTSVEKGTPDE